MQKKLRLGSEEFKEVLSIMSAQQPDRREPATDPEKGFINPYNFVRWASKVHRYLPPAHEKFSGLSGCITVELKNTAPLCIPDPEDTTCSIILAESNRGKDRLSKPFMRVEQNLLFTIEAGFQRELDDTGSGEISQSLIQEFGIRGITLSRNAVRYVKKEGARWRIADNDNTYSIRKAGDNLEVYDEKPYIPGSSLKGMIRSVAEAVSNSCYSVFVDDEDSLAVFRDNRKFAVNFRRLGKLRRKEDGRWVVQDVHPDRGRPPAPTAEFGPPAGIWKARRELYRDHKNELFPDNPDCKKPVRTNVEDQFWQYGRSFPWYDILRGVFGDTERRDYDRNGDPIPRNERPEKPVRRAGEPVITRWPVADDHTHLEFEIEPEAWNMYQEMIQKSKPFRQFSDDPVRIEEWQEDYLKTDNRELFWYRRRFNSGNVCEFGRNFRYKWAYDLGKAIPDELHQCTDMGNLCPCCALFGTVKPDVSAQGAFAGRVSIGPAQWIGGQCNFADVNDHIILGSPKFSCRSFYLKPTDEDSFNVTKDEFVHSDENDQLIPNDIRGRKFYWHHTKFWRKKQGVEYFQRLEYNSRRPEETDKNAKIEVLMPEARFRFQVEFENLSDWELGLLLWSIELSDVEDGAHHLGLGKPIGLGTVELEIQKVELIRRDVRYSDLFGTGVQLCEDISPYLNSFREKMKSWNNVSDFHDLPNVRDLRIILSQSHPECDEAPICYPPGDRLDIESGDPTPGKVHPSELNYKWFCKILEWTEPLLTIEQVAAGQYQNRERLEGSRVS